MNIYNLINTYVQTHTNKHTQTHAYTNTHIHTYTQTQTHTSTTNTLDTYILCMWKGWLGYGDSTGNAFFFT